MFIDVNKHNCNRLVEVFIQIYEHLGVPISHEKTKWATQRITFLGILLNGISFRLAVPEEKKVESPEYD